MSTELGSPEMIPGIASDPQSPEQAYEFPLWRRALRRGFDYRRKWVGAFARGASAKTPDGQPRPLGVAIKAGTVGSVLPAAGRSTYGGISWAVSSRRSAQD
jgi:hypothetical protein